MPQKCETPAGSRAGVSCNQLGRCLHEPHNLSAYRAQHLIAARGIRSNLAAVIASIAWESSQ
jgi:hypothetical protein